LIISIFSEPTMRAETQHLDDPTPALPSALGHNSAHAFIEMVQR
jgi:hypothetical protein